MDIKNKDAYKALFSYFKSLLPKDVKIKSLMTDFEFASGDAAKEIFSNLELHRCFFHFSQVFYVL